MIIFVTGESGSGKSTLAKLIASKLNYKYIDVDSVGHQIYDDPQVTAQVAQLLGEEVLCKNGTIDRKKLGQIYFNEKNSERAKRFDELTWDKIAQILNKVLESDAVLDWAMLSQTEYWQKPALKILVKAKTDDVRLSKIIARDGVSLEYAQLRDSASCVYNENDFDFVFVNDYNEVSLNNCAQNVINFINSAVVLKVLGTQSPYAKENNACPSFLITDHKFNLLLDCGSGSHRFFDMTNLSNLCIVISHLHRDHYNDIYNYMYSAYVMKNHHKLSNPINIFLPTQPEDIYADIKNEKLTFSVIKDIVAGGNYEFGDYKIEFLRVTHSDDLPSFAIKIRVRDKIIVYTGDCSYKSKDDIVNFAKNADILICESSLLKIYGFPEICNHLTAFQAGTIAKCANAKKLVLCHFWPDEDTQNYYDEAKSVFENVFVASEKDEFLI